MNNYKTRILFDLAATQPNEAGFHGGSEYAKVLFDRLLQLKSSEIISGYYDPKRDLDENIKKTCIDNNVELIEAGTHKELEELIIRYKYDRFYSALPYEYYDINFSDSEFIFTIHGLRHIEQPTDRYEYKFCNSITEYAKFAYKQLLPNVYKNRKRKQFRKLFATKSKKSTIIVPSLHTKYSLKVEFPELNTEQLKVLYSPLKKLPDKNQLNGKSDLKNNYGVESRDYYLITSARRWIKNSYRAIKAFDELFSTVKGLDKKVLVLGARKNEPLKRGLANPEMFVFKEYVPESDLNLLYSEAFSLIYPTLNEGFGYPPLESMKYGTPVLSSATTSLYEVCGDAVLYFNPYQTDELKKRILAINFENGLWDLLSKKGMDRYQFITTQQNKMLDELCYLILKKE